MPYTHNTHRLVLISEGVSFLVQLPERMGEYHVLKIDSCVCLFVCLPSLNVGTIVFVPYLRFIYSFFRSFVRFFLFLVSFSSFTTTARCSHWNHHLCGAPLRACGCAARHDDSFFRFFLFLFSFSSYAATTTARCSRWNHRFFGFPLRACGCAAGHDDEPAAAAARAVPTPLHPRPR